MWRNSLWQREQELLEADEQTKSKEYGQIFEIVMHLLEKYNLLLGQEPLDAESFTEVLDAGLSAASVAVIPPGYDSVTIGDIERTRLNHVTDSVFCRCERRAYSKKQQSRRHYLRI